MSARAIAEAGTADCFACLCLNVRIVVDAAPGRAAKQVDDDSSGQGTLRQDRCFEAGRGSQISIVSRGNGRNGAS